MPMTLTGSGTGTVGVPNSATAQNSTSGTSINFTGLPAGIKRITVMFSGVSTNGSSPLLIQLGTGSTSYVSTGYSQACFYNSATGYWNLTTAGFALDGTATGGAGIVRNGAITLSLLGNNTWTSAGTMYSTSNGGILFWQGGSVPLGAAATAVRVTANNGTDAFSAGSINIIYE